MIRSGKEETRKDQAKFQLLTAIQKGRITILKDSILSSSSSIFPCKSQMAISDQKLPKKKEKKRKKESGAVTFFLLKKRLNDFFEKKKKDREKEVLQDVNKG